MLISGEAKYKTGKTTSAIATCKFTAITWVVVLSLAAPAHSKDAESFTGYADVVAKVDSFAIDLTVEAKDAAHRHAMKIEQDWHRVRKNLRQERKQFEVRLHDEKEAFEKDLAHDVTSADPERQEGAEAKLPLSPDERNWEAKPEKRLESIDLADLTHLDGAAAMRGLPAPDRQILVYEGAKRFASAMQLAERQFNLTASFLLCVMRIESNFEAGARSHAGAVGLMQLLPTTAEELAVNPYDLSDNILGGAAFIDQLLVEFDDDVSLAMAAYNAGPNAVRSHGGIPPYRETQKYVSRVEKECGEARPYALSETNNRY